MDVLTLSRLQFAFTVMFHYLFPPLTIGLAGVLVYLGALAALRVPELSAVARTLRRRLRGG